MGITTKKIAVIGAGVAGLATAIRLAVAGHQVQIFEKNAYAGGKLSELCFDGFRFDAGPSLFTMPQFLDELFILANRDPRKYYQYHRLDKCCQYFFEDGSTITSQANSDQFEKELANLRVSTNEWKAFQKRTQSIYDITHHVFLEKSIHQWSTYFNWNTIRSIFRLPWIDAHRTMHQANQKFFKSKNAQQLFDRYATYNGSNPFKAPATLNVIQFYEHHFGAYFPAGGMISITNALVQLSKELDVKINFNSAVQEIIGDSRGVQGVRYIQENLENEWLCDQVVSNADLVHTYRKFLPKVKAPERLLKR